MAPHRFMPVVFAAIVGCALTRSLPSYRTLAPPRTSARSFEQARQHNDEGLNFSLRGDSSRAEGAFREALRRDPTYASAHGHLLKLSGFHAARRY
ncbi:MAG: hypothetical protein L6R00_21405 [Phycisphaerae bacterium]|nr:hypothetical protein [Phycisphaerae bacterium]